MGSAVSLPSHDGEDSDGSARSHEESEMSFSKAVRLKVQLPEPCSRRIDLKLEDDLDFTVDYLKRALEKRTKKLCGISRHQMQIWYKGWWLEDESRTLFGHGVVDGATLYVINGCVPPPTSCSPPPASYHATCTPLCVSLQSLFLFSKALLSVSPSLSSLSAVCAHHLLLAHPNPQRVAHSGKSVATSSPCTREKRAKQRRARASSSDLGAENTSVQASVAATPTRTQVLAKVKASEKFKVTVDVSCIEEDAYVAMHLFPNTSLRELKEIITDRTDVVVSDQILRRENSYNYGAGDGNETEDEDALDMNAEPHKSILELGILNGSRLRLVLKSQPQPRSQQEIRSARKERKADNADSTGEGQGQGEGQGDDRGQEDQGRSRRRQRSRRRRSRRKDDTSDEDEEGHTPPEPLIEVHVHGPNGAIFVIDIAQKCTLGELKGHLHVRSGVKVDEQNLTFQGRTTKLDDDWYVSGGGWWVWAE
mmetsp:Transcript_103996/g.299447  ORF Transcript_103996/g.299447 Transcript_103996/m.299447 type:complete len:479 (+) Transcript_103996:603-2039(+)